MTVDRPLKLEEIQERNKEKARRQDNKQHCQKILQGIGKFDDSTAHRAIWELVQNARDLSEHSHIRIELHEDKFIFAHNGRPFNFDSLSSLIKQVSSEEKEDPDAAGQFGTGFMTTHKFSRVLELFGSYEIAEGKYVSLETSDGKGFVIDRSSDDLPGMIQSMTEQLGELDKLLVNKYKEATATAQQETVFLYHLDRPDRKKAARMGVEAAVELMPYVMTINERIERCTIHLQEGTSIDFRKEDKQDAEGLHCKRIRKNQTPIDVFYLQSEDRKDIVILPLRQATEARKLNNVPRFFIFFPLLGTEQHSINYIFHSEKFFPTEPRDLIVLPDGNSEHQNKIDADVALIDEMCKMLFDYLREHSANISGSIALAPVGFDTTAMKHELVEYFKSLHTKWVDEFQSIPFIETTDKHVSISQTDKIKVLDHTIVEFLREEGNEKYLKVVYDYASKVSCLPKKEEILDWSDIVFGWKPEKREWVVSVEDIVNKIIENNDKTGLLEFLMYLKESGQTEYFRKAIIPNREGVLCSINNLRNGENIPDNLYMAIKPLVPDFTNQLVDEQYVKVYDEWVSPTREDLKTALNGFVSAEEMKPKPYTNNLETVIDFCMTFPTSNTSNTRYQAMEVICNMHNKQMQLNHVPHLGDVDKEQLMYNVVFDSLVKWQFKQIELAATEDAKWYEQNQKMLYQLLNALSNKERPTAYQKTMQDYAIFPNQKGKLCKWDALHVLAEHEEYKAEDIDDLISYYERVKGEDIRDKWVTPRFKDFEKFAEDKVKENVARPIDDALQESNYSSEVTLDIIKHLDSKDENWEDWFTNINKNKAEIFLHRIDNNDLPNVYTLLKDKTKIKSLAELADDPRMQEIIDAGRNALAQKDYENRHNDFIHELGDFVEKLLLKKLQDAINNEQLKVEVCDQQGGQDYKVWVGDKVIYYVEVKSRWSTRDSVEMSALQFKTSVEQKERYSLCIVDMTWKKTEDIAVRKYDDLETCISHTKVLHDIGERNEWCIDSVQDIKDRPHIGGAYSLVVPQKLVEPSGTPDFYNLIERIKEVIDGERNVKSK